MTMNIYVTDEERKEIKKEAKKRNVSVSDLLVVAFKNYLVKEEASQ